MVRWDLMLDDVAVAAVPFSSRWQIVLQNSTWTSLQLPYFASSSLLCTKRLYLPHTFAMLKKQGYLTPSALCMS